MPLCCFLTERTTPLSTSLEEIQQSTRVDDDGGGGIGSKCCRRSGHRSRDKHDGRDGEAGVGVSDRAIESRRMEHPCSDDTKGGGVIAMI